MAVAGLECEFVEKPPKAFQCECPICLLVLREPYQATCCGKSFCKECIHRIKAANQACPTCNDKKFTLFPNKGLQQSLYDFQVYCTHKSKGCEWTGELRELDNHLNSDPPADKSLQGCMFTLIKCPLSCAGCEKGVYRGDIKSHVNDKLLHHVLMQNAQIESFQQQLQGINTQFKMQLEKIKEEKESLEQRVIELETKVSELSVNNRKLDVQNKELEKEIKEMKLKQPESVSEGPFDQPTSMQQPVSHVTGTYKPTRAEFIMTDFDEYKKDNDIWYSPHFYTHPSGYKMCLKVYANGDGSGKGTHLSIYVYLMRGEFDDLLKWPFRGEVSVKLLNQVEDKNHIVDKIHFDETKPAETVNRVIKTRRAGKGRGNGQLVSHSDLQSKFLKDNCIKLCIKRVELY